MLRCPDPAEAASKYTDGFNIGLRKALAHCGPRSLLLSIESMLVVSDLAKP
jgi:hypothetical protein